MAIDDIPQRKVFGCEAVVIFVGGVESGGSKTCPYVLMRKSSRREKLARKLITLGNESCDDSPADNNFSAQAHVTTHYREDVRKAATRVIRD